MKMLTLPRTIVQEYEDGATLKQLAQKYSVCIGTIDRRLERFGCNKRNAGRQKGSKWPSGRGPRKLSDEDLTIILQLDAEGQTHSSIGRQFNVTRERIRQIIAERGLPTRRERLRLLKQTL